MLLPPAFAAVTRALQQLVHTATPPATEVTALSLADAGAASPQSRVNLFLYRISADAALRNQRTARAGKTVTPALELRYLVTAYESPTRAIGQTEHDLLWTTLNAMQSMPHLAVPALGDNVAVRIESENMDVGSLTALWQAARTGLRASLAYTVHLPELAPLDLPVTASLEDIRKIRLERLGGNG